MVLGHAHTILEIILIYGILYSKTSPTTQNDNESKWIHCLTRFGPFSSIHYRYPRSVTLTGQREAIQNEGKNIMALDRHVLMTISVKLKKPTQTTK